LLLAFGGNPAPAAEPGESREEGSPRLFKLTKKAIPLASALRELSKQTGIDIVDKRLVKTDPQLDLKFDGTPFWQALDTIAGKARVVVSLYQADGRIALVDGTYRPLPVSYSGVFRTVVKSLTVVQNFDTGTKDGVAHLEVAWEPRFEPFFLDEQPASVAYAKDKEQVTFEQKGRGQLDVHGRLYLDFTVRFPAPDRAVKKVDLLKGKMTLLTPLNMLTFTFDKLKKIEKGDKALSQTRDGITVRLKRLIPDDDPWDVDIGLEYPEAEGVKFDSYQSWLVNNQIWLQRKGNRGTKKLFPVGEKAPRTTYPRAELVYFFGNKKGQLGKPRDLKLVYRTPGKIVNLPLQFEFKDLKLP
jgi:hypothetical protein